MNADTFIACLEGGLDYFKANYRTIDNLNVFPVPDGDTGVNMLSTLEPAIEAIRNLKNPDYENILSVLQEVTTMNSCGNSGFILSRFFSGFAEIGRKYNFLDPDVFSLAFSQGHYISKTAMSTPMQGTMLSVFEAVSKALNQTASADIPEHLELAARAGREEVFRSPDKLPVLKKAGVVDSGALGFVFILEGMKRRLFGEEVQVEQESDFRFEPDPNTSIEDLMVISNRYCTELTIRRTEETPPNGLEEFLNEIGDSVALLVNEDIIKLHVHTNEPENVISELRRFGEIINEKIEDMKKQMEEEYARFRHEKEIGVLAIVPGEGFRSILHEFEPDLDVLIYGKNLPKTSDILHHVNQMPYEDIIVLANDKNIIPAIQLVKSQSEKHTEIFPSRNIVEGLAAIMGFVKNLSWQENLAQMTEAMNLVENISVYQSIKDSRFADIRIPLGHYFTVMKGDILSVSEDFKTAVLQALDAARPEERSFISLYFNEHTDSQILKEVREELEEKLEDDIEIQVRFGGQHTALLLIGLE